MDFRPGSRLAEGPSRRLFLCPMLKVASTPILAADGKRQAEGKEAPMVKVSIRVRSGTAGFDVAIRAVSAERALSLMGERFSGGDVRVKTPINPEGFFVDDPGARTRIAGSRRTDTPAA